MDELTRNKGQTLFLWLTKLLDAGLHQPDNVLSQQTGELVLSATGVRTEPGASVPSRSTASTAGRKSAMASLFQLGCPSPGPLISTASGDVRWPRNYSGSISHCCHLAVAATTRAHLRIGIDIEAVQPFSQQMLRLMSAPTEELTATPLGHFHPDTGSTIRFSAKEAAYKAMHPAGSVRSLQDIGIEFHESGTASGTFTAVGPGAARSHGSYATDRGMVLTVCWLSWHSIS